MSSNDAINALLHYVKSNYSEQPVEILTIDVMLRIVEEVIKDPSHNDSLVRAIEAIEYDNTVRFNEAVNEFRLACDARALKLIDEAEMSVRVRENRSFSIVFDQIIRLSILKAYVDISDDNEFMKSTAYSLKKLFDNKPKSREEKYSEELDERNEEYLKKAVSLELARQNDNVMYKMVKKFSKYNRGSDVASLKDIRDLLYVTTGCTMNQAKYIASSLVAEYSNLVDIVIKHVSDGDVELCDYDVIVMNSNDTKHTLVMQCYYNKGSSTEDCRYIFTTDKRLKSIQGEFKRVANEERHWKPKKKEEQ